MVVFVAVSMNWNGRQNPALAKSALRQRRPEPQWTVVGSGLDFRLRIADAENDMSIHILVLAVAGLLPGVESPGNVIIQGVVVNGSKSAAPVAGAEVVLLAGKDNQFKHVASTTTNQNGCFVFDHRHLTPSPDLVYVPGANWDGVHYPGPRLQLDPHGEPRRIRLTVHDAVASPCPLVAEVHEIDIHVNTGVLDVTEIVVVDNPSSTTYVGTADPDAHMAAPTTLSMSIPEGVSHVTFNKEFDGRNFRLMDGRLVTSVPWPPGKRQLAFIYQLPVENDQLLFKRLLDLPCLHARVAVTGQCSQQLTCNLPKVTAPDLVPISFESAGQTLPAGYTLQLQMRQMSVSWIVYARWAAIILLGGLLAATTIRLTLRRGSDAQQLMRADPRKGTSSLRCTAKS